MIYNPPCGLRRGDTLKKEEKSMDLLNQVTFRETMLRRYKGKQVPAEVVFELTGRCNLNCKMCYIHTQANSYFAAGEHDGDWWLGMIDAAYEAGMLFALVTGGECLLHPDFRRIYLHLRKKGVYTRINTNGLLLTEETIAFLKKNPPLEVQMTLYGTSDDAYEKVTGARAFHRAEQAIRRMKESGLSFAVAVTPNAYAPEETAKIVAYLKEMQVSYRVNAALFTPYSDEEATSLSDKETSLEAKIQYLRTLAKEPGKEIPLEQLPPVGGGRTEPVAGLRCSGGDVSCFLTWDGCMQVCNAFYNQRIPVKRPEDFATAWETIRQQHNTYPMPVECEGCAYRKACLSCAVLRSGKVGNGHCDPAICEMTRRLVAAGVKKLDQPEAGCQ